MSVFKKAMFYLGLGPDDAYDDEPLEPERPPVRAQRSSSAYAGPDDSSGTVRAIPARRMGEPAELAPWVLLLASGASDFMTGETIVIDGGQAAR